MYVLVRYVAAVDVFDSELLEKLVPLVAVELVERHHPSVFSKVTLVSEVHQANASSPIEVTLSGMVMLVSDLQLKNASLPMEVTLLPMVTLVSDVHP